MTLTERCKSIVQIAVARFVSSHITTDMFRDYMAQEWQLLTADERKCFDGMSDFMTEVKQSYDNSK